MTSTTDIAKISKSAPKAADGKVGSAAASTVAEAPLAAAAAAKPGEATPEARAASLLGAVAPGMRVLAPDCSDGDINGWWEAVVLSRTDTHATLRWVHYAEPNATVPLSALGMLLPLIPVIGP